MFVLWFALLLVSIACCVIFVKSNHSLQESFRIYDKEMQQRLDYLRCSSESALSDLKKSREHCSAMRAERDALNTDVKSLHSALSQARDEAISIKQDRDQQAAIAASYKTEFEKAHERANQLAQMLRNVHEASNPKHLQA